MIISTETLVVSIILITLSLAVIMILLYEKGLDDGIKLTKSMYEDEKLHPNEPDVIEQQQGCPVKENK